MELQPDVYVNPIDWFVQHNPEAYDLLFSPSDDLVDDIQEIDDLCELYHLPSLMDVDGNRVYPLSLVTKVMG